MILECQECKKPIGYKGKKAFSHINCEHCGTTYEMKPSSWRIYMLFPFISVGISVFLSVNFITTEDIFIKAIFIFSVSYILYYLLCVFMIKINMIQYIKR
ncbi:hypothetical protein [Breznakia pachnodae]|uniref:Cxxc_20_cxxc protein n=1 Tax=Breznakia pachnodae TaxID=265178 RepID=A0ABU0E351_9FIRM|nr:hypothetical protein [Breznakia pachnodae]MDQ0361323.1 hypothetical protein [Breznakia pachnodae]